jgi:molybdenum cofactor cytidylyltransferase
MNIEGIILAAGLSSRMGKSKLELLMGDKMVIEHTILSMSPFCSGIMLVCGKQIETIQKKTLCYPGIKILYNENFNQGMFTSVQKGVAAITGDYFFLIPGDCPLVRPETFVTLRAVASGNPDQTIFIPCYNNKKGHPVLFKKTMIKTILDSPSTAILRDIIISNGFTRVPVQDEGILLDMDTVEDFERIKKISASGD